MGYSSPASHHLHSVKSGMPRFIGVFSFQFPLFLVAVLHGISIRGTFWKAIALFLQGFLTGRTVKCGQSV